MMIGWGHGPWGPIIAEIGHGTGPKLRFFWILTPLRNFLVYTHDISKVAYKWSGHFATKIRSISWGYGPLGTKKLWKLVPGPTQNYGFSWFWPHYVTFWYMILVFFLYFFYWFVFVIIFVIILLFVDLLFIFVICWFVYFYRFCDLYFVVLWFVLYHRI